MVGTDTVKFSCPKDCPLEITSSSFNRVYVNATPSLEKTRVFPDRLQYRLTGQLFSEGILDGLLVMLMGRLGPGEEIQVN